MKIAGRAPHHPGRRARVHGFNGAGDEDRRKAASHAATAAS